MKSFLVKVNTFKIIASKNTTFYINILYIKKIERSCLKETNVFVTGRRAYSIEYTQLYSGPGLHRANMRSFGRRKRARAIRVRHLLCGRSWYAFYCACPLFSHIYTLLLKLIDCLNRKSGSTTQPMRIHFWRNHRAHQTQQRILSHIQADSVVLPAAARVRGLHRHGLQSDFARLCRRPRSGHQWQ